jgi:4-oxalocrotonate tautomerase
VEGITKLLENVAGKPPSVTYVVIDEVEKENWAVGGKLLSG